MLTAIKFLNT